jgi:hypothetical protein
VTPQYLSRAGLVVALSLALSVVPIATAGAQSGMKPVRPVAENKIPTSGQIDGALAGIIAGVAVAVIIVIVLIHRSHRSDKSRTITGCVSATDNGMSLTDEGDKRIYALSGNTTGIKPGERMTLYGKKINSDGGSKPLGWKTDTIFKDFGACQP